MNGHEVGGRGPVGGEGVRPAPDVVPIRRVRAVPARPSAGIGSAPPARRTAASAVLAGSFLFPRAHE